MTNRFLQALKTVTEKTGHEIAKAAPELVGVCLPVADVIFPEAAPAIKVVEFLMSKRGSMNPMEAMAISIIMGALQATVKDPKSKATMQTQLVGIGTMIMEEYDYTVTPPAVVTSGSPAAV